MQWALRWGMYLGRRLSYPVWRLGARVVEAWVQDVIVRTARSVAYGIPDEELSGAAIQVSETIGEENHYRETPGRREW